MDIFSIFSAGKGISSIIDKITDGVKWGKTYKQDEENKKIIKSRLRNIFDNYKNDIESIFSDILDEMKSEILNGDHKSNFLLEKIDNIKQGDLLENIDKTTEDVENNEVIQFMWKTFFYDDSIKEIENDLKINVDKFLDIYSREAKNYFTSHVEADVKLLLNEKKEILKMLEKSIYDFEKIILKKLQGLVHLSIINSINPTSTVTDEKIGKMIKNVEKFAKDIEEGKMIKYYDRLLILLNNMIEEMVEKVKK